jgi:hypothetical protein
MSTAERAPSFGRSSHVRTYWLVHSEGFRVTGRRIHGVVEAVQGEPAEARTLVVRRGLLGRRVLLPADAVERVVPTEQLLVVDRPPEGEARRARGRRLVTATERTVDRAGRSLSASAARGARESAALARAARPHALRAAHALARGLAYAWAVLVRGLAYAWAAVAVAAQAAGASLWHGLVRAGRRLADRGSEEPASLVSRVGETVGPLEGPQRRR